MFKNSSSLDSVWFSALIEFAVEAYYFEKQFLKIYHQWREI